MRGFNIISALIWLVGIASGAGAYFAHQPPALLAAIGAITFVLSLAPQIADQWERAIVLRLGRFNHTKGPGVFFIMPFVDRVASWVDMRVITTSFNAEQTLTRDTVPVNVDAVLFWHVHDAEKAALEVQNYAGAIAWASQTALRDLIGRTSLADMLIGRETMEHALQDMIDKRVGQWGVTVQAVELRDVVIPTELQDAMSREAQAEREKNARVILGDAEVQIAKRFEEASKAYAQNPVALHLRAMNMLYEGLKEKGALMVVPSTAVETMGLGGLMGLAAMDGKRTAADVITQSAPATPPPSRT
jgi:regulator of protease activity HflC (stomatin/prohibitin superfamily)